MAREGVELKTVFSLTTGALAAYPVLTFRSKLTLPNDYDLVAVHMAMSYDGAVVAGNIAGAYLLAGIDNPTLTLNQSSPVILSLGGGSERYTSRAQWAPFGDYAVRIPAQSPISLYFTGGASSPSFPLIAVCSLHLIRAS